MNNNRRPEPTPPTELTWAQKVKVISDDEYSARALSDLAYKTRLAECKKKSNEQAGIIETWNKEGNGKITLTIDCKYLKQGKHTA